MTEQRTRFLRVDRESCTGRTENLVLLTLYNLGLLRKVFTHRHERLASNEYLRVNTVLLLISTIWLYGKLDAIIAIEAVTSSSRNLGNAERKPRFLCIILFISLAWPDPLLLRGIIIYYLLLLLAL